MLVQRYLFDFAVLFEGYLFFVSWLLLEWCWLSVSLEDVDILLSEGCATLDVSGKLLVPMDCDDPPDAAIFMQRYI